MIRTSVAGVLAVLGLVTGCGGKKDDGGGTGATGGGRALSLNASGATFQQAFQEVAIEGFTRANKRIKINYGAGGSGKGRQDFKDQVVDFACTDAPFKPAELPQLKGGAFFYFPTVLGAITVSYHLPGVAELKLSPDVLARIFQREITKWNDPALAAANPGVTLPDLGIVVARRSDGSGTTENFTRYLERAAPEVWKLKSGATVEWSAATQAGNGNSGVAQIVKSTPGAIGYVDLSDAKASGLTFAAVKNRAGAYVMPTIEATTVAGEGIEIQDDLIFYALDAAGEAAYPISAQSWCVLYATQADKAKGEAAKAYFRYMLTEGQRLLPEIDFAPIPKALQERALAQLDRVQ